MTKQSENEYLEVTDFIIRDDAIAFTFDSIPASHGRWSVEGVARRVSRGLFRAEKIIASQHGSKSNPWNIEFQVESGDDFIYVEGAIKDESAARPFSGDLEHKVTRR